MVGAYKQQCEATVFHRLAFVSKSYEQYALNDMEITSVFKVSPINICNMVNGLNPVVSVI